MKLLYTLYCGSNLKSYCVRGAKDKQAQLVVRIIFRIIVAWLFQCLNSK